MLRALFPAGAASWPGAPGLPTALEPISAPQRQTDTRRIVHWSAEDAERVASPANPHPQAAPARLGQTRNAPDARVLYDRASHPPDCQASFCSDVLWDRFDYL
jgi:hypothetical protein